jgi:hypothetical protein
MILFKIKNWLIKIKFKSIIYNFLKLIIYFRNNKNDKFNKEKIEEFSF